MHRESSVYAFVLLLRLTKFQTLICMYGVDWSQMLPTTTTSKVIGCIHAAA